MNGLETSGEYKLYVNYPQCVKAIDVYCDGMDTTNPHEYITLKAGEENNFSRVNHVGSVKQSVWKSSTSSFSKVSKPYW